MAKRLHDEDAIAAMGEWLHANLHELCKNDMFGKKRVSCLYLKT